MKVAILLKAEESDQFALDNARKMLDAEKDECHLLAPVSVSGEVPLKKSGEILDHCSEFDLTQYFNKQAHHAMVLEGYDMPCKTIRKTPIGNIQKMVDTYLTENKIEMVLSGREGKLCVEQIHHPGESEELELLNNNLKLS